MNTQNKEIEAWLDKALNPQSLQHPTLYAATRHAILAGGKRFRPNLLLLCAQLLGIKAELAMPVAAAVELIHGYSLIHDDLPAMDDDDYRRGQLTLHKKYDEATAILTGDGLQALAFEWIASHNQLSPSVRCALMVELTQAIGMNGMVGGQMMDMQASLHHHDEQEVLSLQAKKTGALIGFTAIAPAIMLENPPAIEALRHYGEALGLLFQISDDLLDAKSNFSTMGKKTDKDEASGKATLVRLWCIEKTTQFANSQITKASEALDFFKPCLEDENAQSAYDDLLSLPATILHRKN